MLESITLEIDHLKKKRSFTFCFYSKCIGVCSHRSEKNSSIQIFFPDLQLRFLVILPLWTLSHDAVKY